jgi:hypothetical protein
MTDDSDEDIKLPAVANEDDVSPANQPLKVLPRVVAPAGESEVVTMLTEQAKYADDDETKAVAVRLLESGYTVHSVARRLQLRTTTVWCWANEPQVREAIEAGKLRRRDMLGQELEEAADGALNTLVNIMTDIDVNPRDRVKAATEVLDRCGISPSTGDSTQATAVSVDIDFDERLARIVATSQTKGDA